jgi:hypothetical protein
LNSITSIPDFMKIYQTVQKFLVGTQTDGRTDRQTGDLISLLSFLESGLKSNRHIRRVAFDIDGDDSLPGSSQ